jgi:hypothetical protein
MGRCSQRVTVGDPFGEDRLVVVAPVRTLRKVFITGHLA